MIEQTTACVTTFKRPASLNRLLRSVNKFYPGLKVLVEETGGNLSAARNRLAKRCKTEFFLMLEDDFVFTRQTKLEKLFQVASSDQAIGGAGGCSFEPKMKGTANRGQKIWWCRDFKRIRDKIYLDWPTRPHQQLPGVSFRPCDLVLNFGIFRTETLQKIPWNESLPVQEHTDWFYRAYLDSRWHFTYSDNVVVNHYRDRPSATYNQARSRRFDGRLKKIWNATFMKDNAPARLGAPNIVFLGVGRSNTTILSRMIARTLHLNTGNLDERYHEEKDVRFVNQRHWSSGKFDNLAANRAVRKIPQPWIIKEPRFRRSLGHWIPIFQRFRPLLVYVTKNSEVVKASHEKAGWLDVYDPQDVNRCNKFFADWPWQKIRLRAEDISAAIAMFDLSRVK